MPKFGSDFICSEVSRNSCTEFFNHVQLWVKYFFFLLKAQPLYKIKSLVTFLNIIHIIQVVVVNLKLH